MSKLFSIPEQLNNLFEDDQFLNSNRSENKNLTRRKAIDHFNKYLPRTTFYKNRWVDKDQIEYIIYWMANIIKLIMYNTV